MGQHWRVSRHQSLKKHPDDASNNTGFHVFFGLKVAEFQFPLFQDKACRYYFCGHQVKTHVLLTSRRPQTHLKHKFGRKMIQFCTTESPLFFESPAILMPWFLCWSQGLTGRYVCRFLTCHISHGQSTCS